ncbi:MAG: hypothetical protein ACE5FS_00160 [Paracoccaceae bacterium]
MTKRRRIFHVSLAGLLLVVAGSGAISQEIFISSPATIYRDDGARQLNINLPGSLQNPAFSPDGNSIVFTRFRAGYNLGISDIFALDLNTETVTSLVSDGSINVNSPGSSWNGKTGSIVYSSDQGRHDEIYTITKTDNTWRIMQITDRVERQSYEPSFSPNGNWIVFESHYIDVEGNGVITKYRVDGSTDYIDLTALAEDNRQPNWSPDGRRILYQTFRNGNWSIFTMDTNGNNKRSVTSVAESATDAVFSHDGRWIVYSSENAEVDNANIYKVASDGGAPIRVTRFGGYDGAPSISRDGTKIVFESSTGDPDGSAGTRIWIIDN